MPTDSFPTPPPLPAEDPKWQFSLRAMMIGMTGFAVLCGFFAALPTAFSQILLGVFWLGASGWLLTGLVFAKGDTKAFCIGAAVVATSMWTGLGGRFAGGIQNYLRGIPLSWRQAISNDPSGLETWIVHFALVAVAIANGYLCIRARRYFERHNQQKR